MRFAIVNNESTSPSPGLTGSCPACGAPVIAKCGTMRIHHWAHRGERVCDVWWEPRPEWHCGWQDRFPQHWQEVVRYAPSGEKHIADIHTERGLTIEFQYSHIRPEERAARESFYGNMAWVVSGARLRRDLPRFLEGRLSLQPVWQKGVYVAPFPHELFPRHWLDCTVPVFFDFGNAPGLTEMTAPLAGPLWCLLPARVCGMAVVVRVSRESLVQCAHERTQLLPTRMILENVARTIIEAEKARRAQVAAVLVMRRRRMWKPPRSRKRFRRF